MKPEEAINVLRNTAWLGTEKDREKVEKALETLSNHSEVPNSSDLISRQAAIDNLKRHLNETDVPDHYPGIFNAIEEWLSDWEVPSAQPDSKELSSTHKALDSIGRVDAIDAIKTSRYLVDAMEKIIRLPPAQPKQLQILANILDGCPLTQPCNKMWRGGWCEKHCKNNKLQEPDAECWMKYAEVMAADDT